jgi:hypothetical protein
MQQQDEPSPEAGGKTRNPNIAASQTILAKQIRITEIQMFKTVP